MVIAHGDTKKQRRYKGASRPRPWSPLLCFQCKCNVISMLTYSRYGQLCCAFFQISELQK